MSFSSRKILSEDLKYYFVLKQFWQNLGMSYREVRNLPLYSFEMLSEIMRIEERQGEKEIRRQNVSNQNYLQKRK